MSSVLNLDKEHFDPTSQEFLDYPVLNSALPVSAFYGHYSCVRLLLSWVQGHANAEDDDDLKTHINAAALSAIAGGQYHLISELLPMAGPSSTLFGVLDYLPIFHLVCRWNDQVAAMEILNHGDVDPNSLDNYGGTPLTWAVHNEMLDVVRYLLENTSADPNAYHGYGKPILLEACIQENLDLVNILLGRDSLDINIVDHENRSAVSHAAHWGSGAVLRLLLARDDVEPDIEDKYGYTPLTRSVFNKHIEAIKLLLGHPKVMSHLKKGYKPRSPLYFAVVDDNLEALRFLLGEDVSHPRRSLRNWHADEGLTHAMFCSAWTVLPMLASQALKDTQDRSTNLTSEESKNRFLHRIIAGDDHESMVRSSNVPITAWEALAKDPMFAGPVRRSQCPCDQEPLHLAILTADGSQLRGLLLLDPKLAEETWSRTGINPVSFAAESLHFPRANGIVEVLNEKIPRATYLALPQILEEPSYNVLRLLQHVLSQTPEETIDSRLLLDGFKVAGSPLWCTADHGSLFRACLAAMKRENFLVDFCRHETQRGPSLMVVLYKHEKWSRILELYDRCPALARETTLLGAEYSIDRTNRFGQTLFFLAILERRVSTSKAMLALEDVGAVVNKPDPYGLTPLALAVMTTNLGICNLLLAHPSVNPNIQDDNGFTPLHHAVHQAYKWCHRPVWKRRDLPRLIQCAEIIELLYSRSDIDADMQANEDYPGTDSEAEVKKTATNMAKDLALFLLGGCADLDAKHHGEPDSILRLVSILNFLVALPEEDAQDARWRKDEDAVEE